MSTAPRCPEPEHLRELLDRDLPSPLQTQVTNHLETCGDCQHALEHMAAGSSLWAGTAEHLAQPRPDNETALEQVMHRLKGSPGDLPTVIAGTEAPSVLELEFLGPPKVEGDLGSMGIYRILKVIGRGGMGVVLLGLDPGLNRRVAIKVLAPHLAASVPNRKRFLREAQVAASIRHEHFVCVHAVDEWQKLPFIVMEFIDGESAQDRLDRGERFSPEEVIRIGREAAEALAMAHGRGLIHRDIKPANILLERPSGKVKITDFGLARGIDDVTLTQRGTVAGTPQYMAPEQARGEKLDARADLFSLGSVLYTLCTGKIPFAGENSVSVLFNVCQEVPPDIRYSNPTVPSWLIGVVAKLMEKKPQDRIASATELADLLNRRTSPVEPETRVTSKIGPVGRRRLPPGSAWFVAVAAMLLLVSTAAVYVLRLNTPQGTLVVEVFDPAIKATVNGQEIALDGAGIGAIRLNPGTHRVAAIKDGKPVPLSQEWVTIVKEGKEVVRATIEPIAAPAAAKGNLLTNPGFEEASDRHGKEATYWIALPRTTATEPEARCYRDTTDKLKGDASLVVVKPEMKSTAPEAGFIQNVTLLPASQTVHLSGALKTKDVQGSVSLKLRLIDAASGLPVKECSTPPIQGTTDWKHYGASVEVPAGAVGIVALVIQGKGQVWFDDVHLGTDKQPGVAPVLAAPREELLENGGFDKIVNGQPLFWQPVGAEVAGVKLFVDSDVKHGDIASASIINPGKDQEPYNWRQDVATGIPAGENATLTGWIKTKDATLASVGVQLIDEKGQLVGFKTTQTDQPFTGTADWKPFRLAFAVPKGTARMSVLAMVVGKGQGWFDDFSLKADKDATDKPPNPEKVKN